MKPRKILANVKTEQEKPDNHWHQLKDDIAAVQKLSGQIEAHEAERVLATS